ncbi:MAG: hypothetical protein FWF36_06880 [Propionibacteriaceae bacterium]|nr:hypothetical protein [Propionibacteriaceae bacterium]
MEDVNPVEAVTPAATRDKDRFTTGVLVANGVFLGVGAVVLLFAGQRLFGHMLGLPEAAGFLWLLLGVCALALAVLAVASARTHHRDFTLAGVVTLLVFQVGSALVSFIVGLTTDRAVFANFVPHLVLGVFLGVALWRSRLLHTLQRLNHVDALDLAPQ